MIQGANSVLTDSSGCVGAIGPLSNADDHVHICHLPKLVFHTVVRHCFYQAQQSLSAKLQHGTQTYRVSGPLSGRVRHTSPDTSGWGNPLRPGQAGYGVAMFQKGEKVPKKRRTPMDKRWLVEEYEVILQTVSNLFGALLVAKKDDLYSTPPNLSKPSMPPLDGSARGIKFVEQPQIAPGT
ncbi:hypothetical protein FRC12_002002 [Ceratobasidium sp. 428]|nr:hypothetical protein FRC12_002002 [Ceratobasidium sp. 428]